MIKKNLYANVSLLAIVVLAISIVSCSKPNSSVNIQASDNRRPIVVKGLHVGMTAKELSDAVRTTLGSPWKIDRTDDPRQINILNDDLNNKKIELIGAHDPTADKFDDSIFLWLDADDKVEQILIGQKCCGQLFNSQDLSAKEFVQTFMDAYGIGEMKRAVTEHNLQCWEYTSPDNVKFRIFPDKVLNISKVRGTSEVQKNFN